MDIFLTEKVEKCVGKKYTAMSALYPATFKLAISEAIEEIYSKLQPRSILDILFGWLLLGRSTFVNIDRAKEGYIETALIGGAFKLKGKKIRAAIYVKDSGNYKEVWIFTKPADNPKDIMSIFEDWIKNRNPLHKKVINIFGEIEELGGYSWKDIAIPPNFRMEIEENLVWPIKYLDKIKNLNINVARGVLLEGERGMGKTTLTKIIGREIKGHGTYIRARPSDIQKLGWDYVFEVAKTLAPSLLCIEDIENLTPSTKTPDIGAFLTDFLDYLDGVKERGDVLILATTNEPDLMDLRVIDRPGRIDRRLRLDPKDKKNFGKEWKMRVLSIHLKNFGLDKNLRIKDIADIISEIPYTGAHIKELVYTAALQALRREGIDGKLDNLILTREDFEKANEILKLQLKIQYSG